MPAITEAHYQAAYDLAKKIHAGGVVFEDAVQSLKAFGMNATSAKYYLLNIGRMLAGRSYSLSMSEAATEYYLEKIKEDFGDDVFKNALSSVHGYVDYTAKYSKKDGIRKILDKYSTAYGGVDIQPSLENLNEAGNDAKERYLKEFIWREFPLSDDFIALFKSRSTDLGSGCEMGRYTGRLVNKSGQTIDFSYQMLAMATYFVDYAALAVKYHDTAMQVFAELSAATGGVVDDSDSGRVRFFESLRGKWPEWKAALEKEYSGDAVVRALEAVLRQKLKSDSEREYITRYMSEDRWSHSGKGIQRLDYPDSGIMAVSNTVQADQGVFDDFVRFLLKNQDVYIKLQEEVSSLVSEGSVSPVTPSKSITGGENRILYGAPGSGKSYSIDRIVKGYKTIRTVFHPEYQHSDFVGGVRPSIKTDNSITYEYIPGPFVRSFVQALQNPQEHVYLVIEELNRANAAAVFGDIFQLLDRGPQGAGSYSITTDMALSGYLGSVGIPDPGSISIPSNLSILATMNSSDQGVFPLDAAFKRRWKFEYCPLDYSSRTGTGFSSPVVPYAGNIYPWKDFAVCINAALQEAGIEEDRLLGPYFLSDMERSTRDNCGAAIEAKVLIYLWDDVLRHNQRYEVFLPEFRIYSDLVSAYRAGKSVFRPELERKLEECRNVAQVAEPAPAAA